MLTEGPILATRFSLDTHLLAVQRTSRDVEFMNQQKATIFWQRCRRPEPLLGIITIITQNPETLNPKP